MSELIEVCHITTVHPAEDVRIFHKQCASLVETGYSVTLLARGEVHYENKGVLVKGIPIKNRTRLGRILFGNLPFYRAAKKEKAAVFHFHDPEFLPWAWLLHLQGKKVIYDVHEDLPRQLLAKHYLPKWIRKPLAWLVEKAENFFASKMSGVVTATPFIRERFLAIQSKVADVNNFPKTEELDTENLDLQKENAVCYIGGITRVRGIFELLDSLAKTEVQLHLAGNFSPAELENKARQHPAWKQVVFHGFVDRETVRKILARSKAGIVTLHPIINYQDALPVKLFEYMAAGLPVVISDIPLWKQIVEDAGCGIAVNPFNPEAIAGAINQLVCHSDLATQMGAAGKKAVIEKYNWANEAEKLFAFYQKILAA